MTKGTTTASSISKKIHDKKKLRSISILVAYLFLMIFAAIIFSRYVDQDFLQDTVENSGIFGVLIYFLIEVFYVTFTPLFNTFILIASGYLFGGHLGFIINFLATASGLFLIVFLVKRYGRPFLQNVVSPQVYRRIDHIIQRVGPLTLLVCYVLPFTPDDELTYLVAAGSIPFKRYILPILIGTIAKSAYSYIGDLGIAGIAIAIYYRIAMLVLGLILVGIQEYLIKK